MLINVKIFITAASAQLPGQVICRPSSFALGVLLVLSRYLGACWLRVRSAL